ncbi:MAG: hypothetical protein R3C52_09210 [Hyphomonadaceae bacterium]
MAQRVGLNPIVEPAGRAHAPPGGLHLLDPLLPVHDEPRAIADLLAQGRRQLHCRTVFLGLLAARRIEMDEAVVEIDLREMQFADGVGPAGRADHPEDEALEIIPVGKVIKRPQFIDRERSALRRNVSDLFGPDEWRASDDPLLVGPVDRSSAGGEHPVDVIGAASGLAEPVDKLVQLLRSGRFSDGLGSEIVEPEIECDARGIIARDIHPVLFVIEPQHGCERDVLDGDILGMVLAGVELPQGLLGGFNIFRAKANAARASSFCVPPVAVPRTGIAAPAEPVLAELEGRFGAFGSGHCTLSIKWSAI